MAEHWEKMSVTHHSAEELWENAVAYFKWSDENPIGIKKVLMSGNRAGTPADTTRRRPYSLKALCLHCGLTEEFFRDVRNTKDKESIYYIVVSKILYNIWVQNYEGAMIDEFNSIMTMKTLGLDKEEVPTGTIKVEIVHGLPELSENENQILEKLELENKLFDDSKDQSF